MARALGEFEQLLLLALLRLGDQAYGASIGRTIHERTGRTASPGAIYTALDRLERRGFVGSKLGDPTPERGGKRKRFYHLRPSGAAALRDVQQTMAQMARGLKPRLEAS
jgi:DNA-binding PadR family transcriptional regulator